MEDYLVFDIETIGKPWEEFDDKSKEILQEWAERSASTEAEVEKELEQIKEGLPFDPFLGEVVAISMSNRDAQGGTYFRAPGEDMEDYEEDGVQYRVGTEKEILEMFWEKAANYSKFVTFNGRSFDVPFLMIRSAVNQTKPSVNLMGNRYLEMQRKLRMAEHIDLFDQLSFYGSVRRRPKLHFATQAFGIESPKGEEMDGAEVPQAFKEGRYKEIAKYCMHDVVATKKLYEYWDKYLNL